MIALAHVVLLAWMPLGLLLFTRLPGRRALLLIYVLGFLFLPEIRQAPNNPEAPEPLGFIGFKVTKPNVMAFAALLGSLLYDTAAWRKLRLRWYDLPAFAWCFSPLISVIAFNVTDENPFAPLDDVSSGGLGVLGSLDLYDGLSQSLDQTLAWGIPYLLGRTYLTTPAAFRDFAVFVLVGALLYVPLCLLEVRLSPQLHRMVYGFHQHSFVQTMRFGGFRPTVFLEHGLAVGMWMSLATLTGLWLWWSRSPARLIPGMGASAMPLAVLVLVVTMFLCKSTGALVLGGVGVLVLAAPARLRPILLLVLLACVPAYPLARASGAYDGRELVAWLEEQFDEDRAQSLDFRFRNEDMLSERALLRPLFGWGGWGRSRVRNEFGEVISVADGLWVIALGDRGSFGLCALLAMLILPPALFVFRTPLREWRSPERAAPAAWAVALGLIAIDYLLNAQVNPVYSLAAGGLAGMVNFKTPDQTPAPPAVSVSARFRCRRRVLVASSPRPWRRVPNENV